MLFDHGWDAPHPEQWTSPEGTTFLLSEPDLLSDPGPLFRCLEASLWADFWLAADCGYCGLGLAGGCDMTVLRRQWNETNPTPKPQACCSIRLLAGTGFARKHAAHLVEQRTPRRRRTGSGSASTTTPSTSHPFPPAARTLGDAETCPALWIRGLVPAQFLHKFPIPEDTLLFGCKEAATNDITAPRHGERSSVAFGDASTGRHASDTRHRRVGTAAIILAFTGAEWSDIEKLSMQQLLDKTAPAQHDADEDEAKHLTEPLSRRLEKAFTMWAGWMQALPGAPQTTPGGEFWAFTLALTRTRGPLLHYADYLGLVSGFHANRHLSPSGPLKKLWARIGSLVTSRGSSVEVRHVGRHATAADVVERRAQLPEVLGNNMADTLARMSADTLECDEARVQFNTHLEQLASCIRKRSHLVNVAAHQVEAADRPPRARPLQPRPLAGSKRERLLLETTHTLTETDNQFHCESCHATVSRERLNSWLQRGPCLATLDAHAPIFIGRVALHGSHTLTFLDDRRTWTCTACGHVARLRALKLGQPCSRVLSEAGRRNMVAVQNDRKVD